MATEPKKNISLLLAAMARLLERRRSGACRAPARKLVLVGPQGWRREEVGGQIEDLGLGSHVARWGYVKREEMPLAYGAAFALVFPSEIEGFGLPPLEAMACGVPVITTGRGGLADCVGGAAWLVDELTPCALADAMEALESVEALWRRLSEAGRRRAGRFNWDEMARRMVEVYELATRTPGAELAAEAAKQSDTTTWLPAEGGP